MMAQTEILTLRPLKPVARTGGIDNGEFKGLAKLGNIVADANVS